MYYLTGFADEAAKDLDGKIRATKELGWSHIEARSIGETNLHDLSEPEFERVCGELQKAGIAINCFGSRIANWQKDVKAPFEEDMAEVQRCIPRMKRLGTKLVRIMSYPVLKDRGPEDQMAEERFRRLREIVKAFADEGLQPVHENCMNYGGMGYTYTLRILENVPGLKLVFDTGNTVGSVDYSKPEPYPKQSSWEFYSHVREHVAYLHIKDGRWDEGAGKVTYTMPGEGEGDVKRIVKDVLDNGYDGGISMEPHIAAVYHDESVVSPEQKKFDTYVEYGRRFEALVRELGYEEHG